MQLRNMCLCDYRGTLPSPSVDMKPTQRWGGVVLVFFAVGFSVCFGGWGGGCFCFWFCFGFCFFFFFLTPDAGFTG